SRRDGRGPSQRRHRAPETRALFRCRCNTHDWMRFAIRRKYQAVRLAGSNCSTNDAAAAVMQIDRQNLLERGAHQALLRERLGAKNEQASATLADEVSCHLELSATQRVGLDVRENDCIVLKERITVPREARGELLGASGHRLNEVSRCTLFVAAFPHHRVELKARIAHQSAFDERMPQTGGAL